MPSPLWPEDYDRQRLDLVKENLSARWSLRCGISLHTVQVGWWQLSREMVNNKILESNRFNLTLVLFL